MCPVRNRAKCCPDRRIPTNSNWDPMLDENMAKRPKFESSAAEWRSIVGENIRSRNRNNTLVDVESQLNSVISSRLEKETW